MDLKTIREYLKECIRTLETDLAVCQKKTVLEGYAISKNQYGATRYYIKANGLIKYIKTLDEETLKQYCQERFYRKLEQKLPAQISKLKKTAEKLEKTWDVQDIYEALPGPVRKYAVPQTGRQRKMIEDFYTEGRYAEHSTYPKSEKFETEKGDIVRSKSELIIANMLHHAGIPYDYERIVYFKNRKWKFPDFTILNVRTGKKYIWEHFGRLDEEKYRTDTMEKIEAYETNGFIQGVNLIMTFETKEKPLNTKHVRDLINRFFK